MRIKWTKKNSGHQFLQETTQTVIQIIQVTERKFGWENRNILKGVRTIALPLGLGLGLGLRFRAAIVLEPFWKQKSALEMLYNNNNEKNLSKDFIIEVFSYFIRTCHIWSLEISYYNMALALIIQEMKQFRKWKTTWFAVYAISVHSWILPFALLDPYFIKAIYALCAKLF